MAILLTETTETVIPDARVEGERLWLSPDELETSDRVVVETGGPLPRKRLRSHSAGPRARVRAWRPDRCGGSLAASGSAARPQRDGGVWVLGTAAADRAAALRSLEAPDFTLPDRTGRLHSLSEHRGKKVLLVSWASW